MTEHRHESITRMLNMALDGYTTTRERAALRWALGDAAALCDGLARDIAAENRGRNGKGAVTKLGLKLEAIAKRCGDEIWAMRERIDVPRVEHAGLQITEEENGRN